MKRFGIVGPGNWGMQLHEAFTRVGCVCVAHARKSSSPQAGLGPLVTVEQMARFDDIDFVIAAADPETTTRAVEICTSWCKPVVATKPLLRHPQLLGAPVVVDFWRLYSGPWLIMKELVKHFLDDDELAVEFSGEGPYREFPGTLDYGPHALAFALDLGFKPGRPVVSRVETERGIWLELNWENRARIAFGNGDVGQGRSVECSEHLYSEKNGILTYTDLRLGVQVHQEKSAALLAFARHALIALANPTPSAWHDTFRYSLRASSILEKVT